MAARALDLQELVRLTAECTGRREYEAARLEWLERVVGLDTMYCGAVDRLTGSSAVAPTVIGVPTTFVARCESQSERYWEDRLALHRAAARNGGAVSDDEAIALRDRERMPFYREIIARLGIRTIAAVILRARGHEVGCMYLGRTGRGARFPARAVEALRAAAPILGLGTVVHAAGDEEPSSPRLAGLTRREREVAALVCKGMTNQEIAKLLGTSPRTIKNQVASILRTTGTSNRTELAGSPIGRALVLGCLSL